MRWALIMLLALLELLALSPASAQSAYETDYQWDSARRLTGVIQPDADGVAPFAYPAVRYTWDIDGQLTKIETGFLSAWPGTTAPVNWSGFTIASTTLFTYDIAGNRIEQRVSTSAGVQGVTQYKPDTKNRVVCAAVRMNLASIPPAGSDACSLGTQLGLAQGGDGPDRITKNIYDAAGEQVQLIKALNVTTANGFPATLQEAYATYAYSPNGKQTVIIDANGNRAEIQYDGFDRKNCWILPSKTAPSAFDPTSQTTALATSGATSGGNGVCGGDYETYSYDQNDNLYDWRRRNGTTISYRYDALDRRYLKSSPALADVGYTYDLLGHVTSALFNGSGLGVTYSYDNAGRLQTLTDTTGGTALQLGYQYDANSNRTRVTHPDGQYFVYDYDQLNRVKDITENGGTALVTLAYYNTGERQSLTRASGSVSSWTYDGLSRLTGITHNFTNGSGNVTYGFTTYNAASQITTRTRSNDSYAYTDTPSFTRPYSVNGQNQYTQTGPIGSPTSTFGYDGDGNLQTSTVTASGVTTTYTYDVENKLTGASGGLTASLSYDPNGRLNKSGPTSASATRLLYDGDALVAEYDSSGNLLRRYVHGPGVDEPLVWYEGAGVGSANRRFLHADHEGSIIAVSDSGGNLLRANTYDEYGIPGVANSSLANQRFAYTGQILIPELGLYHYKARAYSPVLGRFMQTDPVGYKDKINLYEYAEDDPVDKTDPNGRQSLWVNNPMADTPAQRYSQQLRRDFLKGWFEAGMKAGKEVYKDTAEITYGFLFPEAEEAEGAWIFANESMSVRAMEYQISQGGRRGMAYLLNGVKFDGVSGRTLIEAKSSYANFISPNGHFYSWFGKGENALAQQAARQLKAAGGRPIIWQVEDVKTAGAIKVLFHEKGIQGIGVQVSPKGQNELLYQAMHGCSVFSGC